MRKIVHIAQDAIRRNMKTGSRDPVVIVRDYKGTSRHQGLVLRDKATGRDLLSIKYSPDKPLPCGARVWIEANSDEVEMVPT